MSLSCDQWRGCTRVLGGFSTLERLPLPIQPNGLLAALETCLVLAAVEDFILTLKRIGTDVNIERSAVPSSTY
jgi:hypothetical protein